MSYIKLANDNSNWEEKVYGVKHYSLDDEINLPDPVKQTRRNKIKAIDKLKWIKEQTEYFERYWRSIPEEDDANHAAAVQELMDAVMKFDAVCNNIHATIWKY